MNNSWWQDVVKFILIILIFVIPDNFREWANLHNPDFLPKYGIYYAFLFCVSFIFASAIPSITSGFRYMTVHLVKRHRQKNALNYIDEDEEALLSVLVEMGGTSVLLPPRTRDAVIAHRLYQKGIFLSPNKEITGNYTYYRYELSSRWRQEVLDRFGTDPT